MKKSILTLLILTCVLFAGAKAYIALFTYQTIETLKSELQEEAAITYSWISSNINGEVIIHDLVVTPYQLKQTYRAELLSIDYGSFPSLLAGLLDIKNGVWSGIEGIAAQNASTPLEGRGLIDWLSLEYDSAFSVPLAIYACGPNNTLSPEAWKEMGVQQLAADLSLAFTYEQNKTEVQLQADLRELGALSGVAELNPRKLPLQITKVGLDSFEFNHLELQHIEKGFFRRLGNYCSAFKNISNTEFAQEASTQWTEAMNKIGFEVDATITSGLENYLSQGGKASLSINPIKPFRLSNASSLLNNSISGALGLKLTLNDQAIEPAELYLRSDYFVPPVIEVEQPKVEAPVVVEKKYVSTEWDELKQYEKFQIKVTLNNSNIIEGTLLSVNEHTLDIAQRVASGEFTTHPYKRDIATTEIWR